MRVCDCIYYFDFDDRLTVLNLGMFVIQRLQQDQQLSAGGEAFKYKYVWQALSDKKTYIASEEGTHSPFLRQLTAI